MNEQRLEHDRHAIIFLNKKIEGVARDAIAGGGYFQATAEAIVLEGKVFPPAWGSAVLVLAVLVIGTAANLLGVLEIILLAIVVPVLYLWIGSGARKLVLPYSTIRDVLYDAEKQAVTLVADQHLAGGSAPTSIHFRPKKRDEFETISAKLRQRLPPAAPAASTGAGGEQRDMPPVPAAGPGESAIPAQVPGPGTAATADSRLVGIRGWLLLPAIGFVIGPLGELVNVFTLLKLSSEFERARAGTELLVITLLKIGMLIYMIAVAVAFFRKRKGAPSSCMRLLLAQVVVSVVEAVIAQHAGALGLVQLQIRVFLLSVLQAVIWIPYFKWSKRVKATFVTEAERIGDRPPEGGLSP